MLVKPGALGVENVVVQADCREEPVRAVKPLPEEGELIRGEVAAWRAVDLAVEHQELPAAAPDLPRGADAEPGHDAVHQRPVVMVAGKPVNWLPEAPDDAGEALVGAGGVVLREIARA